MLNFLKKKQKPKIELKQIYKDKNGHVFYEYLDPRQMPGVRLRVAEIATVEADMKVSAKTGIELLDLAMEKLAGWSQDKKGFGEGLTILVELKRRFVALIEEKTLLKLATIYFTMDAENETQYISSEQTKKIDAWDADLECKDFFLCVAVKLTGFFGDFSTEDILKYLKENQKELEKVEQFLQRKPLKNTSKN